jgi:hypothetical protein
MNSVKFRIAKCWLSKQFVDRTLPDGRKITYPEFWLQLLFGRTNKDKTRTEWPVTIIVSPYSDQFKLLLNAIYTSKVVEDLIKSLILADKYSSDAKYKSYKNTCNLIFDDISEAYYAVEAILTPVEYDRGKIYQIKYLKKSDHRYDKDTHFNWPSNFTPGKKPPAKTVLDTSKLFIEDDVEDQQEVEVSQELENNIAQEFEEAKNV